jgi:O-antigen ligase
MLANGKGSTYSDSERLISMAAGIQLIKANLITGVGTGDLQDEMNKIYSRDYPFILPTNRKLPHNQFIWIWASNGLLGICALCGGIIYPMLYRKNYRNLLLLLFFIICISSFITEATLEIQVGIAFYVSWLTILLNYLNGNHSHEDSI